MKNDARHRSNQNLCQRNTKNKKLLPSRPFSGRYDNIHVTFSVENDEDVMRSVAMIER